MSIADSPALIVQRWMIDIALLGVDPEVDTVSDYPVYISQLPDAKEIKDRAIAVYDTGGTTEGRIQSTGETIEHFTLQIRIRDNSYDIGYAKASAIAEALDLVNKDVIVIGLISYTIFSANRSPIIPLGPEFDKRRRHGFTINVLATIAPQDVDNPVLDNLVLWLDASILGSLS